MNPELRPSQVTLKTVFTVAFGVLLVLTLVAALVYGTVAIGLITAALLIAVALDHAVRWLQRRGMRRGLAIATVMGAGLVLLVGCGFTIIPPAVAQARALMWEAPGWVRAARGSSVFATLDQRFHVAEQILRAERQIPEMLRGATLPILNAVGGVLSGIAGVVTIAFLAVFMLIFGERLIVSAIAEARPERRSMYEVLLAKVYRSIGGYLGGLAFICTVNALLTTAFLAVIRLPFFLPLGIVAGFSSMVPYAGPFVMGAFISLIALLAGGPWYGLATASYFVLYGQLEGNVLSPLIFRKTVHVNPLVTLVSILFLGEIGGVVGAVIAVPVVATLQIILREVLRNRRRQLALQRQAEALVVAPAPVAHSEPTFGRPE